MSIRGDREVADDQQGGVHAASADPPRGPPRACQSRATAECVLPTPGGSLRSLPSVGSCDLHRSGEPAVLPAAARREPAVVRGRPPATRHRQSRPRSRPSISGRGRTGTPAPLFEAVADPLLQRPVDPDVRDLVEPPPHLGVEIVDHHVANVAAEAPGPPITTLVEQQLTVEPRRPPHCRSRAPRSARRRLEVHLGLVGPGNHSPAPRDLALHLKRLNEAR